MKKKKKMQCEDRWFVCKYFGVSELKHTQCDNKSFVVNVQVLGMLCCAALYCVWCAVLYYPELYIHGGVLFYLYVVNDIHSRSDLLPHLNCKLHLKLHDTVSSD